MEDRGPILHFIQFITGRGIVFPAELQKAVLSTPWVAPGTAFGIIVVENLRDASMNMFCQRETGSVITPVCVGVTEGGLIVL